MTDFLDESLQKVRTTTLAMIDILITVLLQ